MGAQGWKYVSSQFLKAVRYNAIKQELELSFNDGGHEKYLQVPPTVYEGLMAAKLKDKYHQKNILKKYICFALPRS